MTPSVSANAWMLDMNGNGMFEACDASFSYGAGLFASPRMLVGQATAAYELCMVCQQERPHPPPENWFSKQRITIKDAINAYTYNNAFADFEDRLEGSITVGKPADVAVFSQNLLRIEPKAILDTIGALYDYWWENSVSRNVTELV